MALITITERQADVWRTAAVILYNAIRGRGCDQTETLMIRENDDLYHGEVVRCVMAALIENAERAGLGGDERIKKAREVVVTYGGKPAAVKADLAVEAAHQAAHDFAAITELVLGREQALAKARMAVDHFAVGDFGPNVKVE